MCDAHEATARDVMAAAANPPNFRQVTRSPERGQVSLIWVVTVYRVDTFPCGRGSTHSNDETRDLPKQTIFDPLAE